MVAVDIGASFGGSRSRLAGRLVRHAGETAGVAGSRPRSLADAAWAVSVAMRADRASASLIRTFLSFSLEIEIEGVAPWRRVQTIGGGRLRRSSAGVDLQPPVRPRSATSETGDWNRQDSRQALEP